MIRTNVLKTFVYFLILSTTGVYAQLPCKKPYVFVTGFAQAFIGDRRLEQATIVLIERHQLINTNQFGQFGFCALPGEMVTLALTKQSQLPWNNFKSTQIGTFFIPKNGFQGKLNELTFQVPHEVTFNLLKTIIANKTGVVINSNSCQVALTITARGKTLADDPQGEEGAELILTHHGKTFRPNAIYFGILFDKTNPFDLNYHRSSLDGGAIIYNLRASNELYKISAIKPGVHFSSEYFYCRPGTFINLSPPHGVTVVDANH